MVLRSVLVVVLCSVGFAAILGTGGGVVLLCFVGGCYAFCAACDVYVVLRW
jgi:hypothetical protein